MDFDDFSEVKPVSLIEHSLEHLPNWPASANPPLECLRLGLNEVHVWQARLSGHLVESLESLLSEEETARANRFHFNKDRNHFIVARGLLRQLLAAYLGVANPAGISLSYAKNGKPFLARELDSSINFNLAHSNGLALYAFSFGRELGIDLECAGEEFPGDEIAERFFSATEVKQLQSLPAEFRSRGFFNCWTRKEAYIKARGEGLSMPLNEFDVSLAPGEPAALLRNHKDANEVDRWSMRSISMSPGYVAALVVEGSDWDLKNFDL